MNDWSGGAVAGNLPLPEDDATREARHEVLATLLAAYVDGELPPETTAQIDAHLLGCTRCRREVATHRSLSTRLAQVTRPAVSASFDSRMRAAIAAAPIAPPHTLSSTQTTASASAATVDTTSRRRWLLGVGATAVLVVALIFAMRPAAPPSVGLQPAPLVLTAPIPLLASVVADFRVVSARDLPGRARDLETVRGAVPFPVTPLRGTALPLVAAWTTALDGEVAAVLAYKWNETLVLQYVVSDAQLFRAVQVRRAFAEGRAIASGVPDAGVIAWAEAQGGSIVVADVPWNALVALHPRAR